MSRQGRAGPWAQCTAPRLTPLPMQRSSRIPPAGVLHWAPVIELSERVLLGWHRARMSWRGILLQLLEERGLDFADHRIVRSYVHVSRCAFGDQNQQTRSTLQVPGS